MSDAPKMIWIWKDVKGNTYSEDLYSAGIPYRRADTPWLPEELVERIKDRIFKLSYREPEGHTAELLRDILAACEGKE